MKKIFMLVLFAAAADAQQTWDYTDANSAFDGSVTIAAPLAANGTQTVPVTAINFVELNLEGFDTQYGFVMGGGLEPDSGAAPLIDFTMTNDAVTGWSINWSFDTPGTNTGTYVTATLSPTGDSFYSEVSGAGCQPPPGLPSPCQPISFTGSGGTWTASPTCAPEMSQDAAALTLLIGGLLVLRGKRTLPRLDHGP
jgi:hypothetical protein